MKPKLATDWTTKFHPGEPVWIKDFRQKRNWIPGVVVRSLGNKLYLVKLSENGVVVKRHQNQLRPGNTDNLRSNLDLQLVDDTIPGNPGAPGRPGPNGHGGNGGHGNGRPDDPRDHPDHAGNGNGNGDYLRPPPQPGTLRRSTRPRKPVHKPGFVSYTYPGKSGRYHGMDPDYLTIVPGITVDLDDGMVETPYVGTTPYTSPTLSMYDPGSDRTTPDVYHRSTPDITRTPTPDYLEDF